MIHFLFTALLPLVWAAASDGLIEVNASGTAQTDQEPLARAQITREVLEKTAQRYILDSIGEKKFTSNKQSVQTVIKQVEKFVPFVKAGELKKTPDGYLMSVNLKLSLTSLNQLLTKEGLLYESNQAAIALPFVVFSDLQGQRYGWWAHGADPSRSFQISIEKLFETSLRTEFNKKGFYAIKPASQGLYGTVPSPLRNDSLRLEDMASLADYQKAQMILSGQVSLNASTKVQGGYKAVMKLAAYHAQTNRFVGEVARVIEMEPGSLATSAQKALPHAFDDLARDLGNQVFDAWQRGTFGAELLKLNVAGQFSPQEVELFKANISQSVPQVKSVRERLFEPGHITFEVDASGSAADLANRLKAARLSGFELDVADVGVDQLNVSVKTR